MRWGCDPKVADKICCFNRHYAEHSGYWETTNFLSSENGEKEITFYDSVTGKPLFVAPRGRTWEQFVCESKAHGWPSFRDEEVIAENVRVLANGEAVSPEISTYGALRLSRYVQWLPHRKHGIVHLSIGRMPQSLLWGLRGLGWS